MWLATSLVIIVIVVLVTTSAISKPYSSKRDLIDCAHVLDKEGLTRFLKSQYVPSIGLLRASVYTHPDNTTIYVANDNVLAARALDTLGERELSNKILVKLNKEYGGGFNGKIEVLFGINIPDQFYSVRYEHLGDVDGYRIIYERPGEQIMEDWYEYADLLSYRILDKLLEGSKGIAERLFLNLTRMWDGHGFRDKAFSIAGVYAVYKCALFIYVYRALEFAGSNVVADYIFIKDRCIETIVQAQDRETGGIKTDYRVINGRAVFEGDVNVETTSMVVLALCSQYPLVFSKLANNDLLRYNYSLAFLSVLIVVLAIFYMISRMLKPRRMFLETFDLKELETLVHSTSSETTAF